jgi:lipopolysaccharide transport system ATP-binding protein
MSELSIRVRDLSKWYRIEQGGKPTYQTLRDQVVKAFSGSILRKSISSNGKKNGDHPHENFVWALKDVSFDVHRGEVVGLIGPNGAGKSTLLKILTRITQPTHGSIDIYGRIGSLLEVGTGFHRELTGRDNVYLNGAILGMKKNEIARKFDEIVSFAEVEKFIDTEVKYYSSGMTVRLAFAVAAHLEPEILLVDEVLAVGDAAFQKKSLSKMESVGKSGRTIIFVSHHMPSITRLCERALLLNHGMLLESGPAEKVVGDYLSANLGTNAYKDWPDINLAPSSEDVRLRSVRVTDENGHTNFSFDIRKPVGIELTFDVLRPTTYPLYPFITGHNEEEVHLFTSIDTDSEWRQQTRPPGRYVSTAWIPGNFLAEGTATIGVGIRTEVPHILHFFEYDTVAFQTVESPEGDSARVDYSGRMRGVVRPYLRWSTQHEPESMVYQGRKEIYGRR